MPTTLKEFEAVFPSLVEDLTQHAKSFGLPEKELNWFQEVCELCSSNQLASTIYYARMMAQLSIGLIYCPHH